MSKPAPEFIAPNPLVLEIAKMYLEKFEKLEPDDRKLFRSVLGSFDLAHILTKSSEAA